MTNNMKVYCMCLHDHLKTNLIKLNYIPVGLGENKFSEGWIKDNTGENISFKNKNYGEYTFYYWFWKNLLPKLDENTWVGFSGYRYHWSNQNKIKSDDLNKIINKDNFNSYILKSIPQEWSEYNAIVGEEMFINNWKFSKILKHGKKRFFTNPFSFLKKNQNIKLHFDIFHGDGIIEKASELLENEDKDDFKKFIIEKYSFNRENLFFCRSKKIMNAYFGSVFPWLERCEKLFDYKLTGYSMTRIYAFLAERYLSYWFNKYTKPKTWPIFFYDTNKNIIKL